MKKQRGGNGIDTLIDECPDWLRGRRFGLIAHPASVDVSGCPSATRLREVHGDGLAALFSPEHGYFGIAGAGEKVSSARHPSWGIPVHSLYGKTRKPGPAMLKALDALVFDLQDLSIRCYTYVSTLRYILEAAAHLRIRVIVCDRGNPLAGVVDGPMLDQRFESFVGCFPGPLVYGMSSGAAARHLVKTLKLRVDLRVAESRAGRAPEHAWISPSPGIRNPHTARCYPVTVGFEALPAVDYGRQTLTPFELVGVAGIDEYELAERLEKEKLPGMAFHPLVYEGAGLIRHGVRLTVLHPEAYRPVETAVAMVSVLQKMIGKDVLWKSKGARPRFFDQLYGTDSVRRALQAGVSWRKIAAGWQPVIGRWITKAGC